MAFIIQSVKICALGPPRPRAGLAYRWGVRLVSGRTPVRYCFGSHFSSERLWFVDSVLWLCPSLPTETFKWLSSLPILMQDSFWWWQCSDRYIISLSPHLHTPPPQPFSPSLISLMVSVDVKHHGYLLTSASRVQELCKSRGGHPGLPVLMSLMVCVDVKQHWILLTHWSQFVPNMSTDIREH